MWDTHPGGRLHTTAKTLPPPVPSGAMGMGVSQFVKEPHTCTWSGVVEWTSQFAVR